MARILVTGGVGFIGSHLSERLLDEGHEVTVLDNLRRFGPGKIEHLKGEGFEFFEEDIREKEAVEEAMEEVETVFHLAAQSNVKGSLEEKDYSFETNVEGTWNVLRAAEEAGVGKVVFASSREVYGDAEELPVPEDEPLDPKNFYGASKAAAEHYLQQFNEYTELDTVALRIANAYGPGDRDRVIPIFLERARNGEDLVVYGGEQVLDFVWIEDVVDAFLKAAEDGFPYQKMNVGSGEGTSIIEMAEKIIETTGSESEIVRKETREFETNQFVADISRMERKSIVPRKLEEGLKDL